MKNVLKLIKDNRKIFYNLLRNDFRAKYVGSNLGVIWGYIQPLITILIYWFVFQVGLRSGDRPDGTKYILWLICGMIPWFYIAEAIGSATNTFIDYGYLVKKINFHIGMLPFIKIGSAFIVHTFFVLFTTIIFNFYGYKADWNYLQLIYYMGAATFLCIGITLITSSLAVFIRDVSQIVGIFIQVGFWAIPIVWGPEILSGKLEYIFKLNPVFYIVEGFRDTLISSVGFWEKPVLTIYFWVVSIVIFAIGYRLFRRLKTSFADVL